MRFGRLYAVMFGCFVVEIAQTVQKNEFIPTAIKRFNGVLRVGVYTDRGERKTR